MYLTITFFGFILCFRTLLFAIGFDSLARVKICGINDLNDIFWLRWLRSIIFSHLRGIAELNILYSFNVILNAFLRKRDRQTRLDGQRGSRFSLLGYWTLKLTFIVLCKVKKKKPSLGSCAYIFKDKLLFKSITYVDYLTWVLEPWIKWWKAVFIG